MKRVMQTITILASLVSLLVLPAAAADDSKVKAATGQVETGAKEIGHGQIGTGTEHTAKGIGNTIAEGAKYTGEKFKESGQAVGADLRPFEALARHRLHRISPEFLDVHAASTSCGAAPFLGKVSG